MNPKAICAVMTFHHLRGMQTFYRMHNIQRFPTGPHTPWTNRAEIGVRLFKRFLSTLVDTVSKNLDKATLSQITNAQLMRKAATVRKKHTCNSVLQNACGVGHGKERRTDESGQHYSDIF